MYVLFNYNSQHIINRKTILIRTNVNNLYPCDKLTHFSFETVNVNRKFFYIISV